MSDETAAEQAAQTGHPEPETTGVAPTQGDEKMFTAEEVNEIVKQRLLKEHRKLEKKSEVAAVKKPASGVEEDLRSKLTQYEAQLAAYQSRLQSQRDRELRTTVEKKLMENGCNDPELLTTYLLSKQLVSYDENDELQVQNANNSLDELIQGELKKRSHLVKPNQTSGVGSKAPGAVRPTGGLSPKDMTSDQWKAYVQELGIGPQKGFRT
jgi:hypothetical protein